MELERRVFMAGLEVEERDDKPPLIRGHAAVFNKLSENLGGFREKIAPGAFQESIEDGDDVRALFNHNPDNVLGRTTANTLSLHEDRKGLVAEIVPPDTQLARDLMTSIRRGDVDQMSFGFTVRPEGSDFGEDKNGDIIRTLTNVKLFDVSPVTFAAFPQTDVAVRQLEDWKVTKGHTHPVKIDAKGLPPKATGKIKVDVKIEMDEKEVTPPQQSIAMRRRRLDLLEQ